MTTTAFGDLPTGGSHDLLAPEHIAEVVAWLASDAAEAVTGQVVVVHGAGIQVMRTWAVARELARDSAWTDDELLGLRDALFLDGATRHVAAPVADLFLPPAAPAESS